MTSSRLGACVPFSFGKCDGPLCFFGGRHVALRLYHEEGSVLQLLV
jgi:hypothetical protein